MRKFNKSLILCLALLIALSAATPAQSTRSGKRPINNGCLTNSSLTGLYRIDVEESDKLYSVIESAASSVPFGEQQMFFIDLAVRLTPPDLLAIECTGNRVSLASSRAPRMEFLADGKNRSVRNTDGNIINSRIGFERNSLTFNSSSKTDDNLSFTFTPFENGQKIRVVRRISSKELIEPVIIRTVYNKINEVARWDIFDDSQKARQTAGQDDNRTNRNRPAQNAVSSRSAVNQGDVAESLREALYRWIDATNDRDIDEQMSFYMPQMQAFYLARNTTKNFVRIEKTRAFSNARSINITAAEPEIIFQENGRTAIMRFRKKYNIQNGSRNRSGEVVQELRWRKTNDGWKIFSERDIRVLR
jgi:ketosteroid isomerase-like protein